MTTHKKFAVFWLSIIFIFLIIPTKFAAAQNVQWNEWNGMQWNFTEPVLRLKGDRTDQSDTAYPWAEWKYHTETLIIENGTTEIGPNYFENFLIMTSASIPESITAVEDSAFLNCRSLKSLQLPEKTKTIGNGAFSGCNSLTSIKLPSRVTSFGESVFYGCKKLTKISIPKGVTSIGGRTFSGCSSLADITIPAGVTSIENGTFSECNSLKSITLPDEVTFIGGAAFSGCSSLTEITIPAGVTSIEYSTFRGCSSLKSITLPSGLTSIDEEAFYGCGSLEGITVPDGVTSIGDLAFYDCRRLRDVKLPGSLASVDSSVFSSSYLHQVELSEGTKVILEYAFEGSRVGKIIIPDSVKYIDEVAFSNDTVIFAHPGSFAAQWAVENDRVLYLMNADGSAAPASPEQIFEIDKDGTLTKYRGADDTVIIPDTVKAIGESAFSGKRGILNVNIPEGVTSIENYAFAYCTFLESVVIPESVTSIGYDAFSGCFYMKNVLLPKNIEYLNSDAFDKDTIVIYAYRDSAAAERAEEYGYTVQLLNDDIDRKTILNILELLNDVDETAMLTIPAGVRTIQAEAFRGDASLYAVTISGSVKTIGARAFADCLSLRKVTIPASVTSIAGDAFASSINFPMDVTIHAYSGSYAAQWASENGYKLKLIGQ